MTKDTVRSVLSGFIVGSFIGALGALYIIPIPTDNKDLIVFMLGQLSGFAGAIVAFHFGTSKSSVDKNNIIAGFGATVPEGAAAAARQTADAADARADQIERLPVDTPPGEG